MIEISMFGLNSSKLFGRGFNKMIENKYVSIEQEANSVNFSSKLFGRGFDI